MLCMAAYNKLDVTDGLSFVISDSIIMRLYSAHHAMFKSAQRQLHALLLLLQTTPRQ